MRNLDYSTLGVTPRQEVNSNMVLDCDEVLVNISIPWIEKIYQNKDYFSQFINFPEKPLNKIDIYSRKKFLIEDLFEYKNEEYKDKCKNEIYSLYSENRFYDNLIPSRYGTSASMAASQSFINKVYIITRHIGSNQNLISKKGFLMKLFKSSKEKLSIIEIGANEKKSDKIKDINSIALYAEDELNNIIDVVENCNLDDTFINIPNYGYNKPNDKIIQYSNSSSLIINYFDPS